MIQSRNPARGKKKFRLDLRIAGAVKESGMGLGEKGKRREWGNTFWNGGNKKCTTWGWGTLFGLNSSLKGRKRKGSRSPKKEVYSSLRIRRDPIEDPKEGWDSQEVQKRSMTIGGGVGFLGSIGQGRGGVKESEDGID